MLLQAERLRAKESYTPRAAYTNAKAELTPREITLLQKSDEAAGTVRSAVSSLRVDSVATCPHWLPQLAALRPLTDRTTAFVCATRQREEAQMSTVNLFSRAV